MEGKKNKTEPQQKRKGLTQITSVSVSKEFLSLVNDYNLSPTECFRRGVAVMLCDLGVGKYVSPINEKRNEAVKDFMKEVEVDERIREEYNKIILFKKLKKQLNQIKKIIAEIEQ